MNVDIPVLEQIMGAGIQKQKEADVFHRDGESLASGGKKASIFELQLREMMERLFPGGAEGKDAEASLVASLHEEGLPAGDTGDLAGKLMSGLETSEAPVLPADIPAELLMEMKTLLGLVSVTDHAFTAGDLTEKVFSAKENELPDGEIIPFPREAFNEELVPGAAGADFAADIREAKEMILTGEALQEAGKGALKEALAEAEADKIGEKASSEGSKGDTVSVKSDLKDIIRLMEVLQKAAGAEPKEDSAKVQGEAAKAHLPAGDKAVSGEAKSEAAPVSGDFKSIIRLMEVLQKAAGAEPKENSAKVQGEAAKAHLPAGDKAVSGEAKSEAAPVSGDFKNIIRVMEVLQKAAGAEPKENSAKVQGEAAKAKPVADGKAASAEAKADAASFKADLKNVFRLADAPREAAANAEDKEGVSKAKENASAAKTSAAAKKSAVEGVKNDLISGKAEVPLERPAASGTLDKTVSAEKAKQFVLDGGAGALKKTPAVFADSGGSMSSPESNVNSREQAHRFVLSEPDKEVLLNLSRFNLAEVSESRASGAVAEELNQSSERLRNNIMDQIFGRLTYFRETGNLPAEMRVTLNPPSLGEVIIRVFSSQGRMSAEIITGMNKVKEILETGVAELKQRLQSMNITLEKIDVFSSNRDSDGSSSHFSRENRFFESPETAVKGHYRGGRESGAENGELPVGAVTDNGSGGSIDLWA